MSRSPQFVKIIGYGVISKSQQGKHNPIYTVCVWSGVFPHNQDSVGNRGLYRHNKRSLLVWTGDDTPVDGKIGTIKRLVTILLKKLNMI